MRVLSLFDGMSCGQIALRQLGIIPEAYYAAEIDKHAIGQTQLNFPDTVQMGDVTKWQEWDIDWKSIDLLLAGSPCQGFSFAGKQLAFDDPRSKLFFVFIDILNHIRSLNPDVKFLLENVNMKRNHMRIISEYCGLFPVNINSNLVSAQNRDRWYWTNIRTKQVGLFGEVHVDIPQPEDRGIVLRDILEEEVDEKYYVSSKRFEYVTKAFRLSKKYTQINSEGKSLPLMAKSNTNWNGDYVDPSIAVETNCITSVQKDNLILQRARGNNKGALFEGKSPTLSSCAWEQNNLLCISSNQANATISIDKSIPMVSAMGMGGGHVPMITSYKKEIIQLNPSKDSNGIQPYQQDRVYDANGISPALCVGSGGMSPNISTERIGGISINDRGIRPHRGDYKKTGISELGTIIYDNQKTDTCVTSHVQKFISADRIRRLTPLECSRLQTVPSWYRWECSDTQAYKMLGNGWTVDVIAHILSYFKQKTN